MRKLINGIVEFRRNVQNEYIEKFSRLAQGQKPDSLFIACSDSRVVPNTFASTDPGDLFVLRNVGNLIPPCGEHGVSVSDESEAAAIEFAVLNLNVAFLVLPTRPTRNLFLPRWQWKLSVKAFLLDPVRKTVTGRISTSLLKISLWTAALLQF